MNTPSSPAGGMGTSRLIVAIAVFVVVGAPMVYYLWTTINHLLAGQFEGTRFLLSLLVLLIFGGLLGILSRSIRRWDERPL